MKHSTLVLLLFSIGLLACVGPTSTPSSLPTIKHPTLRATVINVHDGDTITVLVSESKEKVRLNGIDCPESNQPWGQQATQLTRQLVDRKEVTVTDFGRDKYHRMIGQVVLSDGRNLGQELVREGFCWWYQKYAPNDTVLKQLEQEARDAKRGLWSDDHPIPPWEWRHQNR